MTTHATLSTVPFPSSKPYSLARRTLLVLGGAALVALAAQISIPLQPVPITLQTLAVLLVGAALGARGGAAAMLTYLAAGAAGLPVFAGGAATLFGLSGGLRPSVGYLLSYVLAAALVGFLVEKFGADRTPLGTALAMLAGNVVIYFIGVPVLGALTGLHGQALLGAGLLPFLPGDLFKVVLAAALLPSVWAWVRRR